MAGEELLVVRVPMQLTRRRGRKQIIAPDGTLVTGAGGEETRTNRGLAVAIALAHRWRRLLEEGRYGTIGELARAVGVDNSYVARQLRLTLLAPDLVEAVLEGKEPSGLSLEKLYGAPLEWHGQRRMVGHGPGQL